MLYLYNEFCLIFLFNPENLVRFTAEPLDNLRNPASSIVVQSLSVHVKISCREECRFICDLTKLLIPGTYILANVTAIYPVIQIILSLGKFSFMLDCTIGNTLFRIDLVRT